MFRKKNRAQLPPDTSTFLRKEMTCVQDLIPACKAGSVREVIDYVKARPNDLYVNVPTDVYVYDQKLGLQVKSIEMNLLTYSLLYAD